MEVITAAALRQRHRHIREAQSQAMATRLHRSISWLRRSEANENDDDTRFIHLWISLNAAYAGEFDEESSEQKRVANFVSRLVSADTERHLHTLLFEHFTGHIRLLIDNRYVFAPFWRALRDHDSSERWKEQFDSDRRTAMDALLGKRTTDLLTIVLSRLYVLRNQLVHGGATWNSSVNRQQLRDGCGLLGALMPIIISVMMETDAFENDAIAYPVLPEYTSATQVGTSPANPAPFLQGPATATGTVATTD